MPLLSENNMEAELRPKQTKKENLNKGNIVKKRGPKTEGAFLLQCFGRATTACTTFLSAMFYTWLMFLKM